MSTNPWDANFTPAGIDPNLIKEITGAVTGAVAAGEQVVEQVVPAATPVISGATQAVESVLPGVVPPVPPGVTTSGGGSGGSYGQVPASSVTNLTEVVEQAIEAAAKGGAQQALKTLAPSLEAELAKEFQSAVGKVVNRATGGTGSEPTPTLEDFTHADARSRAFRTLLIGLGLAVLTGLGTAVGQLAGLDFSTHTGQVAAVSIASSALIGSLTAYFGRLLHEPAPIASVSSQLVSKGSTTS